MAITPWAFIPKFGLYLEQLRLQALSCWKGSCWSSQACFSAEEIAPSNSCWTDVEAARDRMSPVTTAVCTRRSTFSHSHNILYAILFNILTFSHSLNLNIILQLCRLSHILKLRIPQSEPQAVFHISHKWLCTEMICWCDCKKTYFFLQKQTVKYQGIPLGPGLIMSGKWSFWIQRVLNLWWYCHHFVVFTRAFYDVGQSIREILGLGEKH